MDPNFSFFEVKKTFFCIHTGKKHYLDPNFQKKARRQASGALLEKFGWLLRQIAVRDITVGYAAIGELGMLVRIFSKSLSAG